MKGRRLGRGFDFLLSSQAPLSSAAEPASSSEIDVDSISSNPWQPRLDFDEAALEELTHSIRTHGVLQPIVVRSRKGSAGFEVVAGERRLLAARRAGIKSIPALVREVTDQQMLPLALIENVQRRDLGPVERARAFERLAGEFKLSHQQIAETAGIARSTVTNVLRILELDAPMLQALSEQKITEGHARALLAQPDPKSRLELFRRLLADRLSVREVERSTTDSSAGSKRKKGKKSNQARALERTLAEETGLKVEIAERGKRGRIIFHYPTLEDFDRLFQRITGKPPNID